MDLFVLGKGGTGKELASLLRQSGHMVSFLDDIQTGDDIVGTCASYQKYLDQGGLLVSGIGSYKSMKKRFDFLLGIPDKDFHSFIHSSALIYTDSVVASPTMVFPNSVVGVGASIGKHVLIYHNVVIAHDVKIGNFSIVSNQATVSGNVSIGGNCYIGAGSCVIENLSIGNNSIIAAGSTVVCDVPDNSIYIDKNNIKPNHYFK